MAKKRRKTQDNGSVKAQPKTTETPNRNRRKSKTRELVESLIIAVILALLIRAFIIQAFRIPSGSMEQTLLIGDFLLVNKFIYGTKVPFSEDRIFQFKAPERGDIIVFKAPDDPKKDFIKRIVGVAGDTLQLRNKILYVNGEKQDEPFVQHIDPVVYTPPDPRSVRDNFGPVVVPEGKLFMMGDNRDNSHDSRFWGFLDENEVKGKALVIYFSLNNEKCLLPFLCVPRLNRIGQMIR
ncbi:MAG: signal peptidase I [Gemmatimonadetes bacterium]|nr:MAG: signal peptidase I [Gemmatimonadota bacterium]